MPNRPDRSSAAPPTIVMWPGLSLMDVRVLPAGLVIRCPGCGASQLVTTGATGPVVPAAFVHERDDCPVLLRIEAALARLQVALAAEQN